MDCLVCGCAACYHRDCCDHKNPVPIQAYDWLSGEAYMDWYDEYMTGADIPSWQKIKKKKREER